MPDLSDFVSAFASIAAGLHSAPSGVPGRVWHEVRPWLTSLLANAGERWLVFLQQGHPCDMPQKSPHGDWVPCQRHAVAVCDCCGKQVCLGHGRFDSFGQVICYQCIVELQMARQRSGASAQQPPPSDNTRDAPRPPPKPTMTRAQALRLLKLKDPVSVAEIRTAYRKTAKKYHPDLARTAAEREKMTAKLMEINAAKEALGI